ncbi:phosphatase PAP2 family protein [Nocardiopsis sediminis]|uniref:Phosphatase PAP2 family protein n=1 Tax=Nocardiopsis sediminis TaxID=1778267 RepID=A0ABV8FJ11_9ACTN
MGIGRTAPRGGRRGQGRRPWAHAAAFAVACAVLALVTADAVAGGPLSAADAPVHAFADRHRPGGAAEAAAVWAARLGQRWVTIPLLAAAGVWALVRRRDPRPLLAAGAGLAALAVAGTLLKVFVGRTPPITGVDLADPGLANVAEYLAVRTGLAAGPYDGFVSHPSGHAANAALSYPLLAWLVFGARGAHPSPRALHRALAAAAVPVLGVAAMVVLLDYHWVSEAVTGIALGAAVLAPTLLILRPFSGSSALAYTEDSGKILPSAVPGGSSRG